MNLNKLLFLILILLMFSTVQELNGQIIDGDISIMGIEINQENDHPYVSQITERVICDTIFSFDIRDTPSGLTWDGENLWYVNYLNIYKVSPEGTYIDSFPNPTELNLFNGGGLAFDGTNLWFNDEQSAELFKIDPENGNVLAQYNLSYLWANADPNGFGLSWDGENLWLTSYDPPILFKIDPENGNVINTLSTQRGMIAIEWINDELFGIDDQQLFKINSSTGNLEDTIDWCIPFPLGLTWTGTSLWNLSGPDSLFGLYTGGHEKIYTVSTDLISSSTEELSDNEKITLYPNPINQAIIIKGEGIKSIEIYDLMGRLMYEETLFEYSAEANIPISFLTKGTYFVALYDASKRYTRKIIIH